MPPVAQWILCQQAQLGQAVEHNPLRFESVDPFHDPAHRFAELYLRGMQKRLLKLGIETGLGHEFKQLKPIERPTMGLGDRPQFAFRFG